MTRAEPASSAQLHHYYKEGSWGNVTGDEAQRSYEVIVSSINFKDHGSLSETRIMKVDIF